MLQVFLKQDIHICKCYYNKNRAELSNPLALTIFFFFFSFLSYLRFLPEKQEKDETKLILIGEKWHFFQKFNTNIWREEAREVLRADGFMNSFLMQGETPVICLQWFRSGSVCPLLSAHLDEDHGWYITFSSTCIFFFIITISIWGLALHSKVLLYLWQNRFASTFWNTLF